MEALPGSPHKCGMCSACPPRLMRMVVVIATYPATDRTDPHPTAWLLNDRPKHSTMRTLLLSVALFAFLAPTTATPKDPYHVMWTTEKGKSKCMNKGSKEKADKCAAKMSTKGKATNVKVMAGKCSSM